MRNEDVNGAGRTSGLARGAGRHPADDALAALLEDDGGPGPATAAADRAAAATRRHVAGCAVCTQRLGELRALRDALAAAAAAEAAPPHDLVQGAIARLRLRQGAVDRLNELLTLLAGLARGLAGVLAPPSGGASAGARRSAPPDAAGAGAARG
jgi:hypothetical protein